MCHKLDAGANQNAIIFTAEPDRSHARVNTQAPALPVGGMMAINYLALKNRQFDDVRHSYGAKDSMLYALGIGLGADPQDLDQLRFVYEKDLLAVPTMAAVLGCPGFWVRAPDTGLDWQNILHVAQELTLHQALRPCGEVVGKTAVEALVDKRSAGALLTTRRDVCDAATGELVAVSRAVMLCRSNGNFGGGDPAGPSAQQVSERMLTGPNDRPDIICVLPSYVQSALIYRLSGDDNPLHADIRVAQRAGFERPILHGLCTFGMAGHAALRTLCAYDPARLKKLKLRFSSPFYPGETLKTSFWKVAQGRAAFQCHSVEREVMVINHGVVEYLE
ncbi:MAG: MaoC/PaaZ C-terminal domain-containing protein [Rhodoferax sp.]|uniref:MaoC family dehydratase n=1 Tax=Rhodoferax sp. TaxID=50421 RepID=UPI00262BCBBE|nr:MaoC family dehydratase [Rhodoferax sp.]MDD2880029.1 MaoC/PaaZ C-terminal domain-containing protein [Rhodoferax sp.]